MIASYFLAIRGFSAATLLAQRQESQNAFNQELQRLRNQQASLVQGLTLNLIFPDQRQPGHAVSDVPTEVNPFEALA